MNIRSVLDGLLQKHNKYSVEYSHEIPHLNIVGITLYDRNKNTRGFIECVDETNSTKYKEIDAHGFMKLKLRLLKALKKPLIVVSCN